MTDPSDPAEGTDSASPPDTPTPPHDRYEKAHRYWKANLRIIAVLLGIWAFVSLGCGILFVEFFNQFKIGHLPLGFWIAQQGSIFVFVILVVVYALVMDRLDHIYGVEEE